MHACQGPGEEIGILTTHEPYISRAWLTTPASFTQQKTEQLSMQNLRNLI